MPDNCQSRQRLLYIVPATVIATVMLIYFWAYCMTGSRIAGVTERQIYEHEWQGRLFTPAVTVESLIRQKIITVEWLSENPFP
jgi:hypothetical protein